MNLPFQTITIVGVGLLGGSLGMALKTRAFPGRIIGVGRRTTSLNIALKRAEIDEATPDLEDACRAADCIVCCTPAAAVPAQLDAIRAVCKPNAVVTDVASTKRVICEHAAATWPRPLRFIGSHPMAGSEKYGPQHAAPDLYEGSVVLVSPHEQQAPDAYEAVCDLWRAVGARVVDLPPDLHDALLARTSHVPHIVAAILAELGARCGGPSRGAREVVGAGFRDVTRVAAGRPELWRDICLTNRESILQALDEFGERLRAFRDQIERSAAEQLEAAFESAQAARARVLGE